MAYNSDKPLQRFLFIFARDGVEKQQQQQRHFAERRYVPS
jgi:hypothetical protein